MHHYIITFLLLILPSCWAIECYTGLKLVAGQTFADQTVQCPNSGAQCYNMSASAANVLEIVKAGCSLWRCMLARDRCVSTTFQNIPISLCCCSANRCNVAGGAIGGFQRQAIGGWNAAPVREVKHGMTHAEMVSKFEPGELDDDILSTTSRGNRHSSRGDVTTANRGTDRSTQSLSTTSRRNTVRITRGDNLTHSNIVSSRLQDSNSTAAQNLTDPATRGHTDLSQSTSDEIVILIA